MDTADSNQTLNNNPSQTPSQVSSPTSTPVIIPKKSNSFVAFVLGMLFIILLVGGLYILTKAKLPISQPTPSPVPIASSIPTPDPTVDWTVQTSSVLGIEFKTPRTLGLLDMSGKEIPGEKGTQYCMIFGGSLSIQFVKPVLAGSGPCGGGKFNVGTISRDYVAGREGGFGDFTGYIMNNNQYYVRFIDTISKEPLPSNLITEKTNPNGIKYLKIIGNNASYDLGGEQMEGPIPGMPGIGYIGALINIVNQKYSGFNISMQISSPKDEALFDQILSTFKFLDEITETSNLQTYTDTQYGYQLSYPTTWKRVYSFPESKEFTIQSTNGELIHATTFDVPGYDKPPDSLTIKNIQLKNGKSLLLSYVECDGENCGPGKLEPQTFSKILSTFKFLE